jgi:hypothetical protein
MKIRGTDWIRGQAADDKRFRDIEASVRARKNISRDDYLDLLRSRLKQIQITQSVCRISQKHRFFELCWGITDLYDGSFYDTQRDVYEGEFGKTIVSWLQGAIESVEGGITRQDIENSASKELADIETSIDSTIYMMSSMREMLTSICGAETLEQFLFLEECVKQGCFGPAYSTCGTAFGVWWYGSQDKYDEYVRRMGQRNEAGQPDNCVRFIEERLSSEQLATLKIMCKQERARVAELQRRGEALPAPWF